MTFGGKDIGELTNEELELAAAYCWRMKNEAARVFELNDAGLQEIAEEYAKRNGFELEPDAIEPGRHEIN